MLRARGRAVGSLAPRSVANATRHPLVPPIPRQSSRARPLQQVRREALSWTRHLEGSRRFFCDTLTLHGRSQPAPRALPSRPFPPAECAPSKRELAANRALARALRQPPTADRTSPPAPSSAAPSSPAVKTFSSPFDKFQFEEVPPTRPSPPAVASAPLAAPSSPDVASAPSAAPSPLVRTPLKRKSWLKSTTSVPDVGHSPALETPSLPPPAKELSPPVLVPSSPTTASAEPRLPTKRLPSMVGLQSPRKATPALPVELSAPSTSSASPAHALAPSPSLNASSPLRPPPPPPLLMPPAPTPAIPRARPTSLAAPLPAPPLAPPVSAASATGSRVHDPERSVPARAGPRGHSTGTSLTESRKFNKELRATLKRSAAKASSGGHEYAPAAAERFLTSMRQLVSRAENLPQRELPNWTQDLQSALALRRRSGLDVAQTRCVVAVAPAVAFLARQHFVNRHHARLFLEIATEALPWHAFALGSPAAAEGRYGVDVARAISEVLRAVAEHVADIAAESLDPRQDLMTSLALEQCASAVDRRALDGIGFVGNQVLTRSVHQLQQREAYFGIRTTHDVVDFARRWLSPQTTLGLPRFWSELLDSALRADIVPPPSVDHVVEYVQTCTKMIDLAAEALEGADDIVLVQIRTRELLARVEAIDDGWGSAYTRQLHMLVLDFLAVQAPKLFAVGERSSTKRVSLDRYLIKAVERAFEYHPDPDCANTLTPLLVSLANSRLAADAFGLPQVLRTAVASGKVDAAYLTKHGFLDRLRLAFPLEAGSTELAAVGSRFLAPGGAFEPRAPVVGETLPDVDECLRQCRILDDGSLSRPERDAVIAKKLRDFCTHVIKHVRARSAEYHVKHRHLGPGQQHSHQSAGYALVDKVHAYVNKRQWIGGKTEAEVLASVMNATGYCGDPAGALDIYDRLRRFPLSLKKQGDWHVRALSIVFDVCGQARERKYHVWGLDVWRDFRASGVELNARHWESYREFLARYSDHEKWLDTLPLRFSKPGVDPRLNAPMLEASLILAMTHMTSHSKTEVRDWFQYQGTAWHKQRWHAAQRHQSFGTDFQIITS